MNQHSIQEAYFKPFRNSDDKIGFIQKTAVENFTSRHLGALLKPISNLKFLNELKPTLLNRLELRLYEFCYPHANLQTLSMICLLQWISLHMLRNQRMRNAPMRAIGDYEREFPSEFEKELIYLQSNYKFLHVLYMHWLELFCYI